MPKQFSILVGLKDRTTKVIELMARSPEEAEKFARMLHPDATFIKNAEEVFQAL